MDAGIGAASSAAEVLVEGARGSVVEVSTGRRGAGAGMIWPGGDLVLTNDHVVSSGRPGRGWRRGRGRSTVPRVTLRDGRTFDARVVKRDGGLDLALLRLDDAPTDLPPVAVGDSGALRVGELVFAVGHPWGRPGVATVGIVSGLAREHGGRMRHIVSDVSLAPGNSGGPLLNASGEVVGINAMVSGGFAFSVPSDVASAWATGAPRPRLGVGVVPAGVRGDAGLVVASVNVGGPADEAGIIVGDVLLGTEDGAATFERAADLSDALARAGETARLRVRRGGAALVVRVDLGASGRAA